MLSCWGRGTCDIDFEGLGMRPSRACVDKLHDTANHLVIQPSCQPALQEAHMHQGACEHPVVAPHWGMRNPPHLQADHPVILKADNPVILQANNPVILQADDAVILQADDPAIVQAHDPVNLRADDPVVLSADVWVPCRGQKTSDYKLVWLVLGSFSTLMRCCCKICMLLNGFCGCTTPSCRHS